MAMLAEPRQRKRYNLVPRGKALYEDDSRFGTKMLEKMGWSKGKGLGAKEDGSQEFVRVRYKNDVEGFGFEQRDDQWTQHESSFSGLLKTLNGESQEETHERIVNSDDDEPRVGFGFQNNEIKPKAQKKEKTKLKEKISGISLEERSKQSKARVHYKKFTKGKDLSQYSEKDLANIFGKKVVDDQESTANDLYHQLNQNLNRQEKEDGETNKEDEGKAKADNFGGVQTISTGLSVADYFKIKMAALKGRSGILNPENGFQHSKIEDLENDNIQNTFKQKKKKKRSNEDKNDASEENLEHVKELEGLQEETIQEDELALVTTEKRKKKKNKDRNPDETRECVADIDASEQVAQDKKKSKKRKREDRIPTPNEDDEQHSEKEVKKPGSAKICDNVDIEMENDNNKPKANDLKKISSRESKKNKKTKETTESSPQNFDVSADKAIAASKTKKKNRKAVSHPKELVDINKITNLSLQELKDSFNYFNAYQISSFCAEKFRNINLNFFPRSSLPQIEGYGMSQNIELVVEISKTDEQRITNLWENTLSKYADLTKPKKTYLQYVKETRKARKTKQKRPKLNVKSWKRRNAFAII